MKIMKGPIERWLDRMIAKFQKEPSPKKVLRRLRKRLKEQEDERRRIKKIDPKRYKHLQGSNQLLRKLIKKEEEKLA